MEKEKIDEIKKLPLREILKSRFGMKFSSQGYTLCPFHNDTNPSLRVFESKNGLWKWYCYACKIGGDYIDFLQKNNGLNFNDAVNDIISSNNLQFETESISIKKSLKKEAVFTYENEEGNPVYRKIKFINKKYSIERYENGKWIPGLNNTKQTLYNLPRLIESKDVFLLEGEKDCETLKSLGFVATTAGSVNSWKKEYAKYFDGKLVYICLDVGNEDIANKIASDLLGIAKGIKVLTLPGLEEKEQDITDWFEMMGDASDEEKSIEISGVVFDTPFYKEKQNTLEPRVETIPQFRAREIPEREVFIKNWIEREALSVLAGEQKVGKSIIALNLAFCLALGREFLGFAVPKPRKVLLYQQENSERSMKERIDKLLRNESSRLLNNLSIKNTAGEPLKITNKSDREALHKEIECNEPDLVIFDPFSTFHDKKENDAREMSEVLSYFFEIKKKFNTAILLIHHYGKPQAAQRTKGHLLRGHTIIGDRPDTIINFDRLPDKYKKAPLKYKFENYAEISFVLRNDENPGNVVVERNPETLWYSVVDFYGNLGRKIFPEKVKEIIKEHGGTIHQKKLVTMLCEMASRRVALDAIHEAEHKGYIEAEELPGKGKPKLLKIKDGRQGDES